MVEITESTIQHDIIELERQLEAKKAALGQEKTEKEVLHEVVGEKIQEHVPQYQPQSQIPVAGPPAVSQVEPPSYLSQELKDKIQEIVKLVFAKNLDEGLKEAAKTGNMALIDSFHDIIVDELYNQLIEQRKLTKME
ncbi:MAG: hypothetical protein A3B86_01370 [Candidatus Yanofskybacteria bacterium RIFCSPHIGHO2_02_FULL_38_22b]|uniref:Uncharacterized protein n=1 Tax=Candidatus Yanofskybacteria bacterium RIFCSPHIGHO2_02_FULL_38_22b TaxID=1802673 RepID=A0A1F8F2M7_9BACT|nr:MAG: hypothetical protein A3B86_01370 [Candidatus Yanofskybacteria bacterium RIFCSPHIGHO2_02_FULL_38_22b]OGN20462.1 MAG: hypothetical protein A2910_02225 [Candidatus Yanofskybacteria bacterium RIFCSPLOWO2_01_FULL_39_28]